MNHWNYKTTNNYEQKNFPKKTIKKEQREYFLLRVYLIEC